MESLPEDIVLDIVSRVPAESVLECKLVCKRWVALIRGRNFANMHLSHQLNHLHADDGYLSAKVESCLFFACLIQDPNDDKYLLFHGERPSDRISIAEKYIYSQNLKRIYHPPLHEEPLFNHLVGSCNGLVCAFHHHNLILDPIYICNPLTREYVFLPELVVKKEEAPEDFHIVRGKVNMHYQTACGFGYVQSTKEYKVIRIHYLDYTEGNAEVYTLGSGRGWRAVNRVSHRVLVTMFAGRGTYANDAIYWLSTKNVVAFDLAAEEFRLLTFPPCIQKLQSSHRYGLVTLGGRLCLYMDKSRMEIWSLKKTSDSTETWCMEFDIDHEAVVGSFSPKRMFQPISLTKGGEIIFLYDKSVLYCYDSKTTHLWMISDEESTDYFGNVEVIAHVSTFVSLEAMGENSKRYTVRQRRARTPWDAVMDELDRVAVGEEIEMTRFRLC